MDKKALQQFLIYANQAGYAGGEEKKWLKESDGSTTIPYAKGDWHSHDNFFGGEPYGGRMIVFHKQEPVWMMVYYGWIIKGVDPDPVYAILRGALKAMPVDAPFRGPKKFAEGEYTYENSWTGDIARYSGEEQITQGQKIIYHANYMGGLVDQRNGV